MERIASKIQNGNSFKIFDGKMRTICDCFHLMRAISIKCRRQNVSIRCAVSYCRHHNIEKHHHAKECECFAQKNDQHV